MPNRESSTQTFSVSGFERFINTIIGFIFYYRLLFVVASLVALFFLEKRMYYTVTGDIKYTYMAAVLTGGSIIIGIFYSIINYEHGQTKFKHDVKTSRDILTFNTASKLYEESMINHFRILKTFYNDKKSLFSDGKMESVESELSNDIPAKVSWIIVFNFFETVSLGVSQGIIDERFVKEFFKTLIQEYYGLFGTYIAYYRVQHSCPRVYKNFTTLAEAWQNDT